MFGNLFGFGIFCLFLFHDSDNCTGLIFNTHRFVNREHLQFISQRGYLILLDSNSAKSLKLFDTSRGKVDRTITTIFEYPRDISIVDILKSIAEIEGALSGSELLGVMCRLVEKRDYVRFSDMLIPYSIILKEEVLIASGHNDRLGRVNDRCGKFRNKFITAERSPQMELNLLRMTEPNSLHDRGKKGWVTDEFEGILDLNVHMLLTYSIQQMKPNRRKLQSFTLLQKAIDARFGCRTIATQALSIMALLDSSLIDDIKCSVSLLRLVTQFIGRNVPQFEGFLSKWSPNDMIIAGYEGGSCEKEESTCIMGAQDFIPTEVYLSATAHTPSWRNVNDVMTEFKQHNSWRESYHKLDVVTCLGVIHGTVLDKFLNLLTMKKLRVLNNDKTVFLNCSIYQEALGLVRYLLSNRVLPVKSCNDGLEKEGGIIGDRLERDRGYGVGGEVAWVFRPTSSLEEVLDFIGCGEEMARDSLFLCDPRLMEAIMLTQVTASDVDGVAAELSDVDLGKTSPHAPYCSYFESILASVPRNAMLADGSAEQSRANFDNILDRCDVTAEEGIGRGSGVRSVRVLVLGDGDLSFSASLLKIAADMSDGESDACDHRGSYRNGADGIGEEMRVSGEGEGGQRRPLRTRPRIPSSCSSSSSGTGSNSSSSGSSSGLPDLTVQESMTATEVSLALTVTTFESPSSLLAKYQGAERNIRFIESAANGYPQCGIDQDDSSNAKGDQQVLTEEGKSEGQRMPDESQLKGSNRVMFNVDATTLDKGDFPGEAFDAIIFNFPFGDAISTRDTNSTRTGAGAGAEEGFTARRGAGGTGYGVSSPGITEEAKYGSSIKGSSRERENDGEREEAGTEESEREGELDEVVVPSMKKKSKPTKASKAGVSRSSDFDTHWVARGRHMSLLEGVFRSARNVLHKPEHINGGIGNDQGCCGVNSDSDIDSDSGSDSDISSDRSSDRNKGGNDSRDVNSDDYSDSTCDGGSSADKDVMTVNNSSIDSHPSSFSAGDNRRPSTSRTPPAVGPRVMITLLLSQAQEWEVERIAQDQGFYLAEIIPFEDYVFSERGYSRKRTYVDDIFPSSSSSTSSSSSPTMSSGSRMTCTDSREDGDSDGVPSVTENPQQGARAHAKELFVLQRKKWRQSTVVAWTFVFMRAS